ncbi:MAG: hypothetical protein AB1760_16580, partial [Pseudomonadota bacterium]
KSMAKTSGYYLNPTSGNLTIQQGDVPDREGDLVVYIEYATGDPEDNTVDINFTWPSMTEGRALIVIRNGGAILTGSAIGSLQGSVYSPDGPVEAHGSGNGNFTGFIWGKGMVDIGNFPFYMTEDFLSDPPFYAWTVVRQTAWTEVDR